MWLRMRAQDAAERRTGRSVAPHRVLSWPVARDLAHALLGLLDHVDRVRRIYPGREPKDTAMGVVRGGGTPT